MKVRTAGMAVGLTLVAGLMVSPASAAVPPLVTMKLKVVDQDGNPLPGVMFGATSAADGLTHHDKFKTNAKGVGHYDAYANSTATVGLSAGGVNTGEGEFYAPAGDMYSSTDPTQPYYPTFAVGDAGSTDSLTLPDLVTHRVRLVTRDGKPIIDAQVNLYLNVSVAETGAQSNSYRVLTSVNSYTNSAGWLKFTTFQTETDTDTLAVWGIQPDGAAVSVQYNPTVTDYANATVSYSEYLSQRNYKLVAPYSPHFVHVNARPGPRRGTVVVTATMRQVTGTIANRRVLLFRQASPTGVERDFIRARTDQHGHVTFHVRSAHRARLVLRRYAGTSSPGVVIARPR